MIIWHCTPYFDSTWSGSEQSGLALQKQISDDHIYEGRSESKERFAIQRYLLIIGKKQNMQVLSHTFTYFST